MVVIEMENGGKIELELYPEAAPKTVANFLKLVQEGFEPLPTWQDALSRYLKEIEE